MAQNGLIGGEDQARSNAIMALGAGLLGGHGNFSSRLGQGMQQAMGAHQATMDGAMRRQLMQSQLRENQAQAEYRRAKLESERAQQAQMAEVLRSLGITGGPQEAASGAGAPVVPGFDGGPAGGPSGAPMGPGGGPANPPGGGGMGAPAPGLPQGLNRQAMAADYAFNGGRGIGGMIADAGKPDMGITESGVVYDKRAIRPGQTMPTTDRQGRAIQLMPDGRGGFTVQQVPGSQEAYASFMGAGADAEAAAKARYDVVPMNLPNGQTVMVPRSDLARMAAAGGGGAPGAPAAMPGGMPGGQPPVPQPGGLQAGQVPASIGPGTRMPGERQANSDRIWVIQGEIDRLAPLAQQGHPQATQELQGLQRLLAAYQPQGGRDIGQRGGAAPAAPTMAPGAPGGGLRVMSPSEQAGATATAEGQAKRYVGMQDQYAKDATQAVSQIANLDRMDSLLAGSGGGAFSGQLLQAKSFLNTMGINVDPKMGNQQAAEAIAIGMANGMRQPGTGVMTDADFRNFMQQVPGLAKTPEGREQISRTMRGVYQRQQQEAEMATAYVGRHGRLSPDFEQQLMQWRKRYPLNLGG